MADLIDITDGLEVSLSLERSRLVGLCAAMTGNADVAEDLAQETLLEAWRHIEELRDQEKFLQWLSGIARNVCLRWLRKQGRQAAHLIETRPGTEAQFTELEDQLADDFDLEVELERKELIELLDRAMALLPAETRTVLVERYVQESPLTEVAAKLGINTSAAAMRLQRGKIALRRVLTREFRQEMAAYGPDKLAALDRLSLQTSGQWQQTSIWCDICGQHRLKGRFDREESELWLACPLCCPEPDDFMLHTHSLKILGGVKSYKPALSRIYKWDYSYYQPNLLTLRVPCLYCGRPCVLQKGPTDHPSLAHWHRNRHGVFHCCDYCTPDDYSWSSLEFMSLSLPAVQDFKREHPRIRRLPAQEVEAGGRLAIVTTFESVTNSERIVVVSALDTYETLRIERAGQ
ncbi:MAG TPA: RNA polymerase sigma factor [Ktedonobacteraceae bacterium]|nr:RNA polymerase sigma factor [Ktedonobacteraceae bacterium]